MTDFEWVKNINRCFDNETSVYDTNDNPAYVEQYQKTKDEYVFKQIVKTNAGTIYEAIKKYASKCAEENSEDIFSAAITGFTKAVNTFDKEKGAFNPWAKQLMKFEICDELDHINPPSARNSDADTEDSKKIVIITVGNIELYANDHVSDDDNYQEECEREEFFRIIEVASQNSHLSKDEAFVFKRMLRAALCQASYKTSDIAHESNKKVSWASRNLKSACKKISKYIHDHYENMYEKANQESFGL